MSLSTSPDVLAAHLSGEAVLLNLSDKSYYRLNETAAVIWRSLEKGEDRASILAALTSAYDADADVIESEMDSVIAEMKERKLILED